MTLFERTVEQVAPHLRDGALVVLRSTVYPGTTAYVARRLRRPGPRASTSPSARSGSPRGTPSRSSGPCPRSSAPTTRPSAIGRPRCSRRLGGELSATSTEGGRAGEAVHERLALHEVRDREPVLHDRPPGRCRLHARPATRSGATTRARPTCPAPGFAAGPCLFKDTMQLAAFTSDHFPMGQSAMQVNEGMPAYIVGAWSGATGPCAGGRSASWAWPSRRSPTTPAPRSATSSASCSPGPAHASSARTRTSAIPRLVPLEPVLAEADILVLGVPHRGLPRAWTSEIASVVDVWGALGGAGVPL